MCQDECKMQQISITLAYIQNATPDRYKIQMQAPSSSDKQ